MYKKTGKLIHKNIESGTSKAGKPWTKMTFVIDLTTDPKWPTRVAFDTFKGQLIEFIQDTSEGTTIAVDFDVQSREWNGKWFSNVNADHAEVVRVDSPVHNAGDHNGVDQANQMYGSNGQVHVTEPSFDEDDSLPF